MVGRHTAEKTEQIRQANDILDVVSSYVSLKRVGKDFKALCPFHREKTPSFHVVPEKQIFKCFGCGAGGDVFKFIQLKEGLGFVEARELLATRAGITLERQAPAANKAGGATKADLARVNRWACRWFQAQLERPESAAARRYVADRGVNNESIQRFALGYAPGGWEALRPAAQAADIPTDLLLAAGLLKKRDDGSCYDAFRNRLIFPILDVMGRVVGFGGRTLGDDQAKYINSPQSLLFDKRCCLYGLHLAREAFAATRTTIIVEGYLDCIAAHQHGFPHTVATLGTALTDDHCRILRRYVDTAVLVFDSDSAGRKAADRSLGCFLAESLDVKVAYVPEGKDPADLLTAWGPAAFQSVLTSACDALELKWSQMKRQFRDATTGPDRRRAIEAFLTLLATSTVFRHCDSIQRGLILNQVGKLLGLSGEEVRQQLSLIARKAAPARSGLQSAPAQRTTHSATAAMCDLLAVLMNDPGYYPAVADVLDVELLEDEQLRQIAQGVVEMARHGEGLELARLISRFESQEIARRILDLHLAGERRGNFAATVEGARACLLAVIERRRIESMVARLKQDTLRPDRQPPAPDPVEAPAGGEVEDQRARLRAICEVARKANHFAAGKHLATH